MEEKVGKEQKISLEEQAKNLGRLANEFLEKVEEDRKIAELEIEKTLEVGGEVVRLVRYPNRGAPREYAPESVTFRVFRPEGRGNRILEPAIDLFVPIFSPIFGTKPVLKRGVTSEWMAAVEQALNELMPK